MSPPGAAATAVSVTFPELVPDLDPRNPSARGYDPAGPAFLAAAMAAAADPDLKLAFEAQLRRETARFRAWARSGCGGVGRSDSGAGPFRSSPPERLLAEAAAAAARRRAWRESPDGGRRAALTEAEAVAAALAGALGEARSARSRRDGSFADRARAAAALANRLAACAGRLAEVAEA